MSRSIAERDTDLTNLIEWLTSLGLNTLAEEIRAMMSMPREFEPQSVPPPSSVQPIPCSLVVQFANIQANASSGHIHCEASVSCARNGAGNEPCHGISATFYLNRLEAGNWVPVEHRENSYTPWCQSTEHPVFEADAPSSGYYRGTFQGWDKKTNLNLWSLSVEFQYPS